MSTGLPIRDALRRRHTQGLRISGLLLLVVGCTTVTVTPELPPPTSLPTLEGTLEYTGPSAFLPRSIAGNGQGTARFHYRYDAEQDDGDYDVILTLFNPLTLFGFPTGVSRVAAIGKLEIVNGGEITQYEARCTVEKRRTVYSSRNLSALRARALSEIRDAIDAQLERDSAQLAEFLSSGEDVNASE